MLALIVIGLMIWLVSWAVRAVGSLIAGEPDPPPTSTAEPTEQAPPAECNIKDLELTASTAAQSFSLNDSEAILELNVLNTTGIDCSLNVGTSQQEFLVTSGSDRIFSSKDCQVDPEDHAMVLQPKKKEVARFSWSMNRSEPECKDVSAEPQPGTYKLTVSLGELESDPVTFYLR